MDVIVPTKYKSVPARNMKDATAPLRTTRVSHVSKVSVQRSTNREARLRSARATPSVASAPHWPQQPGTSKEKPHGSTDDNDDDKQQVGGSAQAHIGALASNDTQPPARIRVQSARRRLSFADL